MTDRLGTGDLPFTTQALLTHLSYGHQRGEGLGLRGPDGCANPIRATPPQTIKFASFSLQRVADAGVENAKRLVKLAIFPSN